MRNYRDMDPEELSNHALEIIQARRSGERWPPKRWAPAVWPRRDKWVLEKRSQGATIDDLAFALDVTPVRVRQIEKDARAKR